MKRHLLALALVVTLAGCTTNTRWQFPYNGTEQQFNQDTYECMQQAQHQTSNAYVNPYGGSSSSGSETNMPLAKACMRARGYREVSPD